MVGQTPTSARDPRSGFATAPRPLISKCRGTLSRLALRRLRHSPLYTRCEQLLDRQAARNQLTCDQPVRTHQHSGRSSRAVVNPGHLGLLLKQNRGSLESLQLIQILFRRTTANQNNIRQPAHLILPAGQIPGQHLAGLAPGTGEYQHQILATRKQRLQRTFLTCDAGQLKVRGSRADGKADIQRTRRARNGFWLGCRRDNRWPRLRSGYRNSLRRLFFLFFDYLDDRFNFLLDRLLASARSHLAGSPQETRKATAAKRAITASLNSIPSSLPIQAQGSGPPYGRPHATTRPATAASTTLRTSVCQPTGSECN